MADERTAISPGAQYHCDYCRKDISCTIRIRCASCADFDLCLHCFMVGVEIRTHRNDHPYFVMDQLNFPVFSLDWQAQEEVLLLEGIEMYGVGNWVDIAEHVGTKTGQQCEHHYFSTYIDANSMMLPNASITFTPEEIERASNRPLRRIVCPSSSLLLLQVFFFKSSSSSSLLLQVLVKFSHFRSDIGVRWRVWEWKWRKQWRERRIRIGEQIEIKADPITAR